MVEEPPEAKCPKHFHQERSVMYVSLLDCRFVSMRCVLVTYRVVYGCATKCASDGTRLRDVFEITITLG